MGMKRGFKPVTLYEAMGGKITIDLIVSHFYPKVVKHPDLAPLFPEDISETMAKQRMFLTQFFGGPSLYTSEYGHPMMRARHMRFQVTPKRATAWLSCMSEALTESGISGDLYEVVFQRLQGTAYHMVNTPAQD